MVKFLTFTRKSAGRYFALAALTTTLVACGGSSSGDAPDLDGQDLDGDGIANSEDTDADGDGIEDDIDDFVDLDQDGFDDIIGLMDLDQDGILNKDDPDADGDFLADAELVNFDTGERLDKFVDLNQDGRDDQSNLTEGEANFSVITAERPCGGETGSDAYSENATWDDNCQIRRSSVGGLFADSLYAAGIQRITWCAGFDGTTAVATLEAFSDGEFGPNSEASLKAFQSATSIPNSEPLAAGVAPFAQLVDDGSVGPQTWAKLQKAITRLQQGQLGPNNTVGPDSYGFALGRCANIPLFYQEVTLQADGITTELGGWRLARNRPNEGASIPFSIDAPFGRL